MIRGLKPHVDVDLSIAVLFCILSCARANVISMVLLNGRLLFGKNKVPTRGPGSNRATLLYTTDGFLALISVKWVAVYFVLFRKPTL